VDVVRSPEQSRREFVAWFGGMGPIGSALRLEMAPLAAEILGRDPEDEELRRWANEFRRVALKSWPKAPEGTSPETHLEQTVERWATELRRQVRLNCWDVAFVPIFAIGLPAVVLSLAVPDWAAMVGGVLLAVPLMRWWIRLRKSGRIALSDD
jgi:hypothetical protein